MNQQKLDQLRKMQGQVRTGGKGSVRRKKKVKRKVQAQDETKVNAALKKLGLNQIPGIEEVAFFHQDTVRTFKNPKVQAAMGAPTGPYVISGSSEVVSRKDYEQADLSTPSNPETADDKVPDLVSPMNFEEVATKSEPKTEPKIEEVKTDEVKTEAPKAEHKTEASKAEHKTEAPKAEHKTEAPKAEHKTEAPKAEHKTEAPKAEHKTEAPKAEHKTEAPKAEHKTEAPNAEAPKAEHKTEAPKTETPKIEEVKHEAPKNEHGTTASESHPTH